MSAHSTVFIDIFFFRLIEHYRFEKSKYERQLANLLKKDKFLVYKYFSYLNLDYLTYAFKFIRVNKSDRTSQEDYKRIWSIDGNFAKNRYKDFINQSNEIASPKETMLFLEEISSIFRKAKINVVFVLIPLNKKLIYAYSDDKQADLIYYKLKELNEKAKIYLKETNASYIDLFEAVPSSCFADLLHTNACGDEIIARSLADYVSRAGK